jgi:hypothetical protein
VWPVRQPGSAERCAEPTGGKHCRNINDNNADPDTDAGYRSDADTHTNTDAGHHADADAYTDADADAYTDADADPNANSDADANSRPTGLHAWLLEGGPALRFMARGLLARPAVRRLL